MKKFLAIMLSLILLSGCSLFSDSVNVNELGKEMQKTVSKFTENEQKYIKVNSLGTELGSIVLSVQKTGLNQNNIKQINDKQEEMKKILTEYKTEVQKINEEFPTIQKKVDKIKKENLKKLADTFSANFKSLIDAKQKVIEVTEKSLANQESILKSFTSKQAPSRQQGDEMIKLQGEMLTLQNEFLQKQTAYNKSLQEFIDAVDKK
ncbi:Putative cell-wall binding lipoprotein [Thermoactinomyces sp. DSM 45891]|uniref:hypothetical protein n=1 Tax=Thermoactinomyces sp. DSM 45891 TaxID=1761907 RepID=UPI00091165F6|nr:hypothetical protein [Thermoactinomyces sp. DSM 45891]SFX78212.1 Putative cell-wall binding lipoprotein [Thermoactinomyces sp. DSM 45891]